MRVLALDTTTRAWDVRPGRRVYVGSQQIPKVLGGYGVNIVSTSRGLMSGKTAKRENIGGEVLAQIY